MWSDGSGGDITYSQHVGKKEVQVGIPASLISFVLPFD
jgi:hypothetical protein